MTRRPTSSNQSFFLERELRHYVRQVPDVRALSRARHQLVLGRGRESRDPRGPLLPSRPNQVLAQRLQTDLTDFPGAHVGYLTHPHEFADVIRSALSPAR